MVPVEFFSVSIFFSIITLIQLCMWCMTRAIRMGPETNISSKCTFQVLHLSFWWTISEQNSEPTKFSLETQKRYDRKNEKFCVSIKELYEIRQWECETQRIILNSTSTLQNLGKSPLQVLFKIIYKISFYSKLISECNHLKAFLERPIRAFNSF